MARRGSKSAAHAARIEQERARVYRARAEWHETQKKRRVRDNVLGSIAGAVLVIGSFASQGVYAAVHAPDEEPTPINTDLNLPVLPGDDEGEAPEEDAEPDEGTAPDDEAEPDDEGAPEDDSTD